MSDGEAAYTKKGDTIYGSTGYMGKISFERGDEYIVGWFFNPKTGIGYPDRRFKMDDVFEELTVLENIVMQAASKLTYAEYGFSDFIVNDIANEVQKPVNVIRGVVGSLVKKDLLWIEEWDDGWKGPNVNFTHMTDKGYRYVGRSEDIE